MRCDAKSQDWDFAMAKTIFAKTVEKPVKTPVFVFHFYRAAWNVDAV